MVEVVTETKLGASETSRGRWKRWVRAIRSEQLRAMVMLVVMLAGIVNLTFDRQIEPAKPSCLCAYRFLPALKGLGAQQSIMDRLHEVAAETKEILCESV